MTHDADRELELGTRPRPDYPGAEVYASQVVRIGLFRCPVRHPRFATEGRPRGHIAVFPRSPVRIVHPGGDGVVADPTTVMLYNRGQEYRRERLSEEGDRCEWFALATPLLLEAVAHHDRSVVERPQRPFDRTHGPAGNGVYALQRAIVEHVVRAARGRREPDHVWVDEASLELFRQLLAEILPPPRPMDARSATSRAHRDLVRHAREELALGARGGLTVDELARRVGTSPFHLCRVFRRWTGRTIHDHLTRLRLRLALEGLAAPGSDLAAVAVDAGFAHHSHFTATFRRYFGLTPSELRAAVAGPSPTALAHQLLAS